MRDLSAEAFTRYTTQRRRADSVEKAQAVQRVAAQPPLPLTAFVGTYADSLYGEATITLEGERLSLARGLWKGPLEYTNFGYFRWGPLPSAVVQALQVKFDLTPDGKVSALSFTVGADLVTMAKKAAAGAGRGGRP